MCMLLLVNILNLYTSIHLYIYTVTTHHLYIIYTFPSDYGSNHPIQKKMKRKIQHDMDTRKRSKPEDTSNSTTTTTASAQYTFEDAARGKKKKNPRKRRRRRRF